MRTILIADEDADTRFVSLFFDMDYRVVTTSSGADAISKAREIRPNIVMADVSLSDKDGYEVSREIKNNLLLKDTPVILLTSSLGTFDEIRAAEARADDFIIKPFKFEEIAKRVEYLIGQSKERKIRFADVMPTLLVIFMVTVPLLYQSIDANPPRTESKPIPNTEVKRGETKRSELVIEPILSSESEQTERIEVFEKKEEHLRVKEEPKKPIKVETKKEKSTRNNIAVAPAIEPEGKYTAQIGAFQKEEEAKKIAESLRSKGYPVFIKTAEIPGKGTWHKVRIGIFKTRKEVELYGNNLKSRELLIKKVMIVEEEKPEKKEVAEVSSSEKGKGIHKDRDYLNGIKITEWSLYVASGVPTIHHVTIENTNDLAYRDIKVRVHYYSQSYSNAGTTQIDGVTGILPVTLPPHSKKTYLEKGATLRVDSNSMYSMYVESRDIEILGAIAVPSLPTISQTNKPNSE
jgi:DNA-binding response OmpR family regulator